jgi:hypothetical protein
MAETIEKSLLDLDFASLTRRTFTPSPAAWEDQVLYCLRQSRLMGPVHDFQVVVRDHGLVLRGHSHTYYAKQVALQVARETTCVAIQANEIEVT